METQQQRKIRLAQNFLRSQTLVRRLIGMTTIGRSDIVYEIGPGDGIITAELATIARQVIAIEKDPELVLRLRERFRLRENVEILEKDFLAYSFHARLVNGAPSAALERENLQYKLFANVPYNITSRILHRVMDERSNLSDAYLILQKEAAEKFSGSPRETLFSLLAKPFFELQILFRLKRTDFCPVPSVDSVFLSIKRRTRPLLEARDVDPYRGFVQYGFGRWKPNLQAAFKNVFTYKQWKRMARDFDIPLKATPTELSFEQWLRLYCRFRDKPRY